MHNIMSQAALQKGFGVHKSTAKRLQVSLARDKLCSVFFYLYFMIYVRYLELKKQETLPNKKLFKAELSFH